MTKASKYILFFVLAFIVLLLPIPSFFRDSNNSFIGGGGIPIVSAETYTVDDIYLYLLDNQIFFNDTKNNATILIVASVFNETSRIDAINNSLPNYNESARIDSINSSLNNFNWTNLQNYPVACVGSGSSQTYLTAVNDSTTCTSISSLNGSNIQDIYLYNTGDTATGNYTFDTSTLHIDSTNDRVGIGTATPTAVLDVTQTITSGTGLYVYRNLANTSTDNAVVQMINDYATDDQDVLFIKQDASADSIEIDQNGAGYAIYSNNLNSGTANAYFRQGGNNYVLLVDDSVNKYTAYFYRNLNSSNTALPMVRITQDESADDMDALKIQQDGSGYAINTVAGNSSFDSGTLFIDSTNNKIGIGRSTPSQKLDVNGSINISSSEGRIYAPNITINNLDGLTGNYSTGGGCNFAFQSGVMYWTNCTAV